MKMIIPYELNGLYAMEVYDKIHLWKSLWRLLVNGLTSKVKATSQILTINKIFFFFCLDKNKMEQKC